MTSIPSVIHSDPDIMGGIPVFVGTRVPLQNLLDYLCAGDPLAEFLDDFPSVSREQAVAALRMAAQALVAQLHVEGKQTDLPSEGLLPQHVEQLIDGSDESFRQAAAYVLRKNAELYQRLA
jgi:uncharacterized protein (DUF433 family)